MKALRFSLAIAAAFVMICLAASIVDAEEFHVFIGGVPHVAVTGSDGHVESVTWLDARGKKRTIFAGNLFKGEHEVRQEERAPERRQELENMNLFTPKKSEVVVPEKPAEKVLRIMQKSEPKKEVKTAETENPQPYFMANEVKDFEISQGREATKSEKFAVNSNSIVNSKKLNANSREADRGNIEAKKIEVADRNEKAVEMAKENSPERNVDESVRVYWMELTPKREGLTFVQMLPSGKAQYSLLQDASRFLEEDPKMWAKITQKEGDKPTAELVRAEKPPSEKPAEMRYRTKFSRHTGKKEV